MRSLLNAKPHGPWVFTDLLDAAHVAGQVLEISDKILIHHLKTVMRLRAGESLVLVNDHTHRAAQAEVIAVERHGLRVTISELWSCPESTKIKTTAAVALIKTQRWDWMIQKLTELGVDTIQPLITQHSVVDVEHAAAKTLRWQEIITHAAQQSERYFRPKILEPVTLASWLSFIASTPEHPYWVALERCDASRPLSELLTPCPAALTYVVGPEGGWSQEEREMFEAKALTTVSLGSSVLRAETAAITVQSILRLASEGLL